MRFAIIDLGTNTFNLLIAERQGSGWKRTFSNKIAVKLGENGLNKSEITSEALKRGLQAMKDQAETLKKWNVSKVSAFATSGIRSTSNGMELIELISRNTGIEVEVIDGNREAELIYEGVRQSGLLSDQADLIMDIGGGSTEFIIGNNNEILWKHSFDLGVSRLLERLKPSDPLTDEDIEKVKSILDEELEPLSLAIEKYPIKMLIGSSGSYDSFVEMIAAKKGQPQKLDLQNSHYPINLEDFMEIHNDLLPLTKAERTGFPGLIPMRADMIVYSVIFVRVILNKFGIQKIHQSSYSLKEGALSIVLKNEIPLE